MPSSNRSGTASEDGSSFAGRSVSSSAGAAASTPQCGPRNLYGEQVKKSAPSAATSTGACAVRCTPSTASSAPARCTSAAISATGGRVPIRLDAPVTATSLVRSVSTSATSSAVSSPVAGSNPIQRTVAPAASAARTQGRTFASWSSRETTTSSPGPQPVASVRARSNVSWVALRPNTMPPGSAPSRSATAERAASTVSSASRSAAVTRPRLAIEEVSVSATARATGSGTWVPPGPSKCAVPDRRAGNCARTAATS